VRSELCRVCAKPIPMVFQMNKCEDCGNVQPNPEWQKMNRKRKYTRAARR
jgi:hypothetical protein